MLPMMTIESAQNAYENGAVFAYPTEAVYGLGCDPFNRAAVEHILDLKGRPEHKGMIVLIADWPQLWPLINQKLISDHQLHQVNKTWPGRTTWLFPKSDLVPDFVCGSHENIAIRMTTHPIAKILCAQAPIISTSANLSGQPPAKTPRDLYDYFGHSIEGVVEGKLGEEKTVSPIFDALTGKQLR